MTERVVASRVLIVGENASMKMGGEASFPYTVFRLLRERGVDARLACHARTRDELRELLPHDFDRVDFIEEDPLDVRLCALGQRLPAKLNDQALGSIRHCMSRRRLRDLARRVVAEHEIDLIHEVTPISPKAPTSMHGLGRPVVIGPMCGGMDFPPGFQHLQSGLERLVEGTGRGLSDAVNRMMPGKLRADALIVANDQTKSALPHGCRGKVYDGIPDIAVNLNVWNRSNGPATPREGDAVRFAFLGRLVGWKAADLLLEAFAKVAAEEPSAELEILGDGDLRAQLEAQAERLGIAGRARFAGWVTATQAVERLRRCDVFVLPSLRECGGGAAMEAMALGLPAIVARWGGPGLYINDECGIRVDPTSHRAFVDGLAAAMLKLARDPALRRRMGEAAARHVVSGMFNWDRKIDRFLEIYADTIDRFADAGPRRAGVFVG